MSNPLKQKSDWAEKSGEILGIPLIVLGAVVLLVYLALVLLHQQPGNGLVGLALGLISVGLGFHSIGMAAKSSRRYREVLDRLDKNVARLPSMFRNDILTPWGQYCAQEILSKESREAAQQRLDEDTKRIGHVRGEVYQLEDGSWAIHWGGKYEL